MSAGNGKCILRSSKSRHGLIAEFISVLDSTKCQHDIA